MKKFTKLLAITLALIMSLGALPFAAFAEDISVESVSFSCSGYVEGGNIADAVVTCNTAGIDFIYSWEFIAPRGSYDLATKLSDKFISGIDYYLWIYIKGEDGYTVSLSKENVLLDGTSAGSLYNNYTIDGVNYAYGASFRMGALGGVSRAIVSFFTEGGKIGEEEYCVNIFTDTDGKLIASQIPTPTREGYSFDGWYNDSVGGELLSLDTVFYSDSNSNKYYARWLSDEAVDVNITFDATGGLVNGKSTDTVTIPAANKGKLNSLPIPAKEGFGFQGWYTSSAGGDKINETTVFTEDTIVYALWGDIESVSFSCSGYVEGGSIADAVVTCNTAGIDFIYSWEFIAPRGSYDLATKLSDKFISGIDYYLWIYIKGEDGYTVSLSKENVLLDGTSAGSLYNNYTIDGVNYAYGASFRMGALGGVSRAIVRFYTNGGKIGEEEYYVDILTDTDGKLVASQIPTPTRTCYSFDGWYTDNVDGELLSLDTVFYGSSYANSYYAHWSLNHNFATEYSKDASGHWYACTGCEEKQGFAAHTPDYEEATEKHGITCTECGYIIEPALAHTHNWSTEYSKDASGHWYACTGCEEKQGFAAHTPDYEEATEEHGITCTVCGYVIAEAIGVIPTVKINNNPGTKEIKYGEGIKFTATATDMPDGAQIKWYVNGAEKGTGKEFTFSDAKADATITVKIVDKDGNVMKDATDGEISESEKVTVKAGFFQKLISFFKNLFKANRIIAQSIDSKKVIAK